MVRALNNKKRDNVKVENNKDVKVKIEEGEQEDNFQ